MAFWSPLRLVPNGKYTGHNCIISNSEDLFVTLAKPQLTEGEISSDPGPKRTAIVGAATRVFLDKGYGAASMDAIADEAGVSKQTVYSHFGSKETLFEAIIEDKCNELLSRVSMQAPSLKSADAHDPERIFKNMGESFLLTVLAAPSMALFRVVIAESGRFPELAEAFYRAGPAVALDNLASLLEDLHQAGTLSVPDPSSSAKLFYAMLRGDLYIRRLLDLAAEPTPAERNAVVNEAVAAFLTAHAP